GAETALRNRSLHRLAVRAEGDQRMDRVVEAPRLEDRRQKAGQECRSVAGTGSAPRGAPKTVGLGGGACRARRERARRPVGQQRHRIRAPRPLTGGRVEKALSRLACPCGWL